MGVAVVEEKSRAAEPVRAFALSVKSAAVAVPPLSLLTVLTSVRSGAMSVFVIVQVASPARPSVMLAPLCEPPVQTHVLDV